MYNLNSILIEGNLTKEPEIHTTPNGTSICTLHIVSNHYFRQDSSMEKEVSFFVIEAWSKLAQSTFNIGKKGQGIRVVGRLKQERWQDPSGNPLSKVVIVAEHIEFRPHHHTRNEETETLFPEY